MSKWHYSLVQIISTINDTNVKTNGILYRHESSFQVLCTFDSVHYAKQIMVYLVEDELSFREVAARILYENFELQMAILELDPDDLEKWNYDVITVDNINPTYMVDDCPLKIYSIDYYPKNNKLSLNRVTIDATITTLFYSKHDSFSPRLPYYEFSHSKYYNLIGSCTVDAKNNLTGMVHGYYTNKIKNCVYSVIPAVSILFMLSGKTSVNIIPLNIDWDTLTIKDNKLNKSCEIDSGSKIKKIENMNDEKMIYSVDTSCHIPIDTYIALSNNDNLNIILDNDETYNIKLRQLSDMRKIPYVNKLNPKIINFNGLIFMSATCDMLNIDNICGDVVDTLNNNICPFGKKSYRYILLVDVQENKETKNIFNNFITSPICGIKKGDMVELLYISKINNKKVKNISTLQKKKNVNQITLKSSKTCSFELTFSNVWSMKKV